MQTMPFFSTKNAPIHSCRFSRDGNRLGIVNMEDRRPVVLQRGEGTSPIRLGTEGDVTCLSLSWDGCWLANGESWGGVCIHRLFPSARDSAFYHAFYHSPRHEGSVTDIGFAWSELLCASCDEKGTVFVYHSDDSQTFTAHKLYQHTRPLLSLCFTCDDEAVYCGDSGGYLLRISLSTGTVLSQVEAHSGGLNCISSAPDGKRIATGGDDAAVRIWDVDPNSPTFLQCLQALEVKMNCQGMQIDGARGLKQPMQWRAEGQEREGTLLEFLVDRGAKLDKDKRRQ